MTTKSLTSCPDAVNHRWRVSRSGDNRTVHRDHLMFEQRLSVASWEQWQVALNSVEAMPERGSQECKLLHKVVVRTTAGSASFVSCMWVALSHPRYSATLVLESNVDDTRSGSFNLARNPPAVQNHHAHWSNRGTF